MTTWFEAHKVAANLLMLSLWVLGLTALLHSKKEIIPAIERSFFIIETRWLGQDNQAIEEAICKPLESIAAKQQWVHKTEAIVQKHLCHIIVHNEFELSDEQRESLFNQLRYQLGSFQLPKGASEISIFKQSPEIMLARYTLSDESGQLDYQQLLNNAESIKEQFLQAGLHDTRIRDAKKIETHINISEYTLNQYQLSLSTVSQQIQTALKPSNLGSHHLDDSMVNIRIDQQHSNIDNITVRTPTQLTLPLSVVAEFEDSFDQPWMQSKVNGKPALSISVYQTENLSIDDIQKRLYTTQKKINLQPPLKLTLIQDNTLFYENRITLLRNNALLGLALVFFTLLIFLQMKAAFWVCVGIPTAFISSFISFYFLGTSINMVSTFAFLLIIGVIVDDAIMVAEHLSDDNNQPLNTLLKPLCFAVITTAISFSPLLFIPGAEGQLVKQIPIVVISCLFFSLIECLCILPAHLKNKSNRHMKRHYTLLTISQSYLTKISERLYRPFLEKCLQARLTVLSTFIGLFIISLSIVASGWKPITLHSNIDAEIITVDLQFPDGASPDIFSQKFAQIETQVMAYKNKLEQTTRQVEVANIRSQVLASGLQGSLFITLPNYYQGNYSSQKIATELKTLLNKPEQAKSLNISHTFSRANRQGQAQLRLHLNAEDQTTLIQSLQVLKKFAANIKGVTSTNNSLSQTVQSLNIQLNNLAKAYNISNHDIAKTIQTRFQSQLINSTNQRLKVQLPHNERESIWYLSNTPIPFTNNHGQNQSIPLSQLAYLSYTPQPASSHIKNGRYTAWLDIHFDSSSLDKDTLRKFLHQYFTNQIRLNFEHVNLSPSEQDSNESIIIQHLSAGFTVAILFMFMCMALLFNSYLQPLYVLSAIPFGIIGSLIGHVVLLEPLTIWSVTGIIAVSGIVVNDNIVLVHFINQARIQGGDIHQAILTAGQKRFRPIFLTTITSFIGLLPMLLEKSFEAQFLIPMAISISFGILFATAISLILVPTLYSFSKNTASN